MKKKKEKNHSFWSIAGIIFCIILIPVLVINCTLLYRGYTNKKDVPTIGGIFPMIVLTDSMSGTFESGDLILCHTVNPSDVKVGDIICFYDPSGNGMTTVTHRVSQVIEENGDTTWITKGDANNSEDLAKVSRMNLAGKYVMRFPGLGNVAIFMQSTTGIILCVFIPILLFAAYDFVQRRAYEKKKAEDTKALEKEIEELKKEMERLESQNKAI